MFGVVPNQERGCLSVGARKECHNQEDRAAPSNLAIIDCERRPGCNAPNVHVRVNIERVDNNVILILGGRTLFEFKSL